MFRRGGKCIKRVGSKIKLGEKRLNGREIWKVGWGKVGVDVVVFEYLLWVRFWVKGFISIDL